jgi:hypothetical protein
LNENEGHKFTQVRPLTVEVKAYSYLIAIDDDLDYKDAILELLAWLHEQLVSEASCSICNY